MSRIKIISVITVFIIALGALAGCGKSQQASSGGKLVDGVYKVEFDKYDGHDYKGQMELTVAGGKITDVKYDEVGKDGTLKSKDEQYKRQMEEGSKTYPEKAYNELKQSLLTKQAANVDTVSGATASSVTFKALAKYAVDEMAKKGKSDPAKIPLPK